MGRQGCHRFCGAAKGGGSQFSGDTALLSRRFLSQRPDPRAPGTAPGAARQAPSTFRERVWPSWKHRPRVAQSDARSRLPTSVRSTRKRPRGGFLWTEASRVALPRPGFQRERILHPGAPAGKRRRSLSLRGSGSAGLREGCPPPPTPALLAGSASRSPGPGSPAAARPRRGFRGGPAQGPGLCERLLSAYLFHLFSATQFEAINIDARR